VEVVRQLPAYGADPFSAIYNDNTLGQSLCAKQPNSRLSGGGKAL